LIQKFGALRGWSTTHVLTAITHLWHQALDDQSGHYSLIMARHLTTLIFQQCYQKWPHLKLTHLKYVGCTRFYQTVNNESRLSQWTTLNGGMPQGTWFGPYIFLMLIDDMHTMLDTFKFVDDEEL